MVVHGFPERVGGPIQKDAPVEKGVSVWRGGRGRDRSSLLQSCGILKRGVCTILTNPILRCPSIMIKIADACMGRSDPFISRKCNIEDVVHVLIKGNVRVQEDARFVRGQLKSAEFGPSILETSRYEGRLLVVW